MKVRKKTHSGSKKRFRITGGGKVKRGHSGAAHLLSKKTPKQRRKLRKSAIVESCDTKRLVKALNK
ncbi:MAG: 50S ribosomal protein L35 [Elusimicrobiota bacterium]